MQRVESSFPKVKTVAGRAAPSSLSSSSPSSFRVLHKSLPLAASLAILLWSNPVKAGILSGFSGLESVPGPQLPEVEFLKRFNEENQKKYAENDARFKSSPVLKELLERSRLNKERNKRAVQDKYCIRGAEWGVGDCSTAGMTEQEKEEFITMLKQRAAGENEAAP
ncbi:hypothetical protein H6P81_019898 [Aristolochia fimbriata]|uniref:Uncharacterized protein n=1 Tax=Aristolochia fimbriata TaxID=158543 RepID=A0AAV7DT23_ARIFI|nr:hypothetical protein H6P81_019898 [Aristolochia fimbriata]